MFEAAHPCAQLEGENDFANALVRSRCGELRNELIPKTRRRGINDKIKIQADPLAEGVGPDAPEGDWRDDWRQLVSKKPKSKALGIDIENFMQNCPYLVSAQAWHDMKEQDVSTQHAIDAGF